MVVRVVKVGGSLFDDPHLPGKLARWLERQTAAQEVLIAGGGELADVIRRAATRFAVDPAVAHWICIDLLTASSRLVGTLLPEAAHLDRFCDLQAAMARGEPRRMVFAVRDFLREAESLGTAPPLPHDWSVSSDSIAARLAVAIGATELVLLKSTSVPPGTSQAAAAAQGFVDEYFPRAARTVPRVRWVNLRDEAASEAMLP
jgi:aspartokinase-like uncharacterized kinase